ncbi:MAG: hypothetical protein QOK33_5608 [Mycobacterium sp.]|nr:hypothetical protein [Mycobacterium sp.]
MSALKVEAKSVAMACALITTEPSSELASSSALRAAASAITSYGSLFLGVVKGIIPTPATTTLLLINTPRIDSETM